ncbi:S-adenosylmethionine transporter [Hysterangium stoloniferum]|nr:S-adenosylmethionine transporter [Hysterangium stoloniferum]
MTSPTFTQSLVAGAIAGTTADFIFFPVDTIKTRLQSAQGFLCAGGFRGVYQGIGSVVIGGAPSGAIFFAVYNVLKQNTPLPQHLTPVTHLISGSIAEIISCMIRVPTEVVKTRSQTATFGKSPFPSLIAARRTFQIDGFKGFYRGFGITVARDLPFTAIELPLYEFLKVRLARFLKRDSLHPHEAALCGCIAGGLGAAFTTPLDVLKTRIMLDMQTDVAGSTLRYQFAHIRRNEGLRALFAGALPRIVWMSTGGAVWLGIYEWTIHELMHRQSNIPHITSGIL